MKLNASKNLWPRPHRRAFLEGFAATSAGLGATCFLPTIRTGTGDSPGHSESWQTLDNIRVVNVETGQVSEGQRLTLKGDQITAVGPAETVPIPAGSKMIDGTDHYVIPGLWDMHIHWYEPTTMALFPLNGVTGVRIMSGIPVHHAWRGFFEEEQKFGPRLKIASPLVDGEKPIWPGSLVLTQPETVPAVLAKIREGRADFVKVYSLLPRDVYFRIAEESRALEFPFAGHVPFTVSVREASQAGQKTMEHLYEFYLACSSAEEDLRRLQNEAIASGGPRGLYEDRELLGKLKQRAYDTFDVAVARDLFAELAQNQSWQCPTLTVLRNLAFLETPEIQNNSNLNYFPGPLRKMLAPEKSRVERDAAGWERAKRDFERNLEILQGLHQAGVPILAGTDCLNPFCLPGFSLHDELELLVRAGLSPLAALQAATCNPARYHNQDSELGTIAVGKKADLVILKSNPLEKIGNTREIAGVFLRGRYLDSAEITKQKQQFLEKGASAAPQ